MGEHRKTRRLLRSRGGLSAFGLHTLAIIHCARYLTDGFVEAEFVEETFALAGIRGKAAQAVTAALEEHGQWLPADGGWQIHSYLDHNPSREDVEAKRKADAERKARGRRGDSKQSPTDVTEESARTVNGHDAESDRPGPTRPVPLPVDPPGPPIKDRGERFPERPFGDRKRSLHQWEQLVKSFASRHFPDAPLGVVEYVAGQFLSHEREPTAEAMAPYVEHFTASPEEVPA